MRSRIVISDNAVTAWFSGDKFSLSLYLKLPRALDSAKLPSTLLSLTSWPAASIRFFSIGFWGLWSSDKPIASDSFLQRTALQSPEFTQIIFL